MSSSTALSSASDEPKIFVSRDHGPSVYKIIYGYPAKKHVPESLMSEQSNLVYETINMYGEMYTGYCGQLLGQLTGAYERLITSPDADSLQMMTMNPSVDALAIPTNIAGYLDMSHPPQLHVVLSEVYTVHYACGQVMYGHVCEELDDDACPDYEFAHCHVLGKHNSYFVGVSLGEIPPLWSHHEVTCKSRDPCVVPSSESDVIRGLTTEYVVTDDHRTEAEKLLNDITATSKVIFKNVLMFVPYMCHCCT